MRKPFYIQTQTGETFDPVSGEISEIRIEDIALGLSHMCRYAGQCKDFYSVAEHSVLVYRIAKTLWPKDLEVQWAALLHDATEAYVCDLPTQIKRLVPDYRKIEDSLALKIYRRFAISTSPELHRRVKIADLIALSTEARRLFDNADTWGTLNAHDPMPELLHAKFPLEPKAARNYFLKTVKAVAKASGNQGR